MRERANGRCEYCQMAQALQGATFHIEHILPASGGGERVCENLALACPSGNLHKSDRIEAIDPRDQTIGDLYHPRQKKWGDHFEWSKQTLVGKSTQGRATINALQLNTPRRLKIREAEQSFGLFPAP